MEIVESEESDIEILELQGDVENMEAFNGKFNKDLVQLEFDTFVLQGRRMEKEFCVVEKTICNDGHHLRIVKRIKHVYLFDKPPKYRRIRCNSNPER